MSPDLIKTNEKHDQELNKCHICDIEFDQLELHFLNSHTLQVTDFVHKIEELPPEENESNENTKNVESDTNNEHIVISNIPEDTVPNEEGEYKNGKIRSK